MRSWGRLLLCLALLLALPRTAWAQGGAITGQVSNGTLSPATPLADQPVTLLIYQGEQSLGQAEILTDAAGRFAFEGLEVGEPMSYLLVTRYAEVEYASDWLALDADAPNTEQQLTVYDTTAEADAIHVQPHHMVITFAEGLIIVQEIAFVVNRGNRTFIGSIGQPGDNQATTLRFSLPPEAAHLAFSDPVAEQSIVRTADGFADTRPVPPGRWEYLYSYEVAASSSYTLHKRLYYPTDRINLLVADVGVEVTATPLEAQGTTTMPGESYLYWTQAGLPREAELRITLDQLPWAIQATDAATGASAFLEWLGLAVIALAVLVSVIRPFWYARQDDKRPSP